MTQTSDLQPQLVSSIPYINAIIYGKPGVGKTHLAATAQDHPEMKDVLFLNIEGGLLTVARRGDIRAIQIRHTSQIEDVFWKIAQRQPGFETINTVIIDSATELQTLNLEEIARKKHQLQPNRHGLDELWQEDYGDSTNYLKRIFRWYRDLPVNVVLTALARTKYPPGRAENAQPIEIGPALTESLRESVTGYQDFVWHLYQDEEGKRKLLTQPTGIFRAKTRGVEFADALGKIVENPSLPRIYDLLKNTTSPVVATN